MVEDRIVYLNGEFVAWGKARVHIMCHSFGRGSAIFEVLSLHETLSGAAVFRLDEHLHRLYRSAALLDAELPIDKKDIHQAVLESVRRNGVREGFVKIICFYPQISFEILPPQRKLDVSIFVVDPVEDLGGLAFPSEKGTTACVSKWRKLDPETVPVEAKAAANYLNGMMARAEAKKRGFDHVIMLDTQGFIAEGGTESVFLVKDGILMTPGLGTILQSISRKSLLELAPILGLCAIEGRLKPDLLFEAEEIFFSGTPAKALPIRRIDERVLEGVPGPLCRKLSGGMEQIVAGRDERFKHWLFPTGE
ncbi:MAG: aminotransferase class IV [Deltaproteobacteria bacterium]|nr:aminotransferase class IV [Deltaproteobacteria bacterium]